jgi:exodeoxyribonuclease VII large subunit
MSQFTLSLMPERHVWKVSELTARIKEILESEFRNIWVEGEVSNCHLSQPGHLYFTLKDARSQIRCVAFRDQVRLLKFRPEDGLQVTVRGSVSVYEPRGEYQLYVQHIEPVGLGALQLAFEQLKKRLAAEGLFDVARKRALPMLPARIGVVTSPRGAAVRDILRVLRRRFPNVQVIVYPVKVQGEGAAEEIAEGVRFLSSSQDLEIMVDVIIVARGGGSLEDLWAFNEEVVARAIAASAVPVISGVGHETDVTIADFVADLRAATPSQAAELVVRSRLEFEKHIADLERQLTHNMRYRLSELRHGLRDLEQHRGFRRLEDLVRLRRQQLDEYTAALGGTLAARFERARQRLSVAQTRITAFDLRGRATAMRLRIERSLGELGAALDRAVSRKRRDFSAAQMRFASVEPSARVGRLRRQVELQSNELGALGNRLLAAKRRQWEAAHLRLQERSPLAVLERGYSVVYDASGKVLRSVEQVALGEDISVRLARGRIGATVKEKKNT